MGILTASQDDMLGDPLRGDKLSDSDPLSKAASDRVRIYDKGYQMALHPEEKTALVEWEQKVKEEEERQAAELAEYERKYNEAIKASDSAFNKQISSAKGKIPKNPGVKTIPIHVVDSEGKKIEGTYYLPPAVADELAKNKELVTRRGPDGSFNVSVRTKHGYIRGAELHEEFGKAQSMVERQKSMQNKAYGSAATAVNKQISALQKEYETKKASATAQYQQNITQAKQAGGLNRERYNTYISDMRKHYAAAREAADSSINQLLNSGALKESAKVTNNAQTIQQ